VFPSFGDSLRRQALNRLWLASFLHGNGAARPKTGRIDGKHLTCPALDSSGGERVYAEQLRQVFTQKQNRQVIGHQKCRTHLRVCPRGCKSSLYKFVYCCLADFKQTTKENTPARLRSSSNRPIYLGIGESDGRCVTTASITDWRSPGVEERFSANTLSIASIVRTTCASASSRKPSFDPK